MVCDCHIFVNVVLILYLLQWSLMVSDPSLFCGFYGYYNVPVITTPLPQSNLSNQVL